MVNRDCKYYKLGLVEGRILKGIIEGQPLKLLSLNENMSEAQVEQLKNKFYNVGILGEIKKDKNNPLFVKIPLFEIDDLLNNICNILKHNKCCLNVSILIWVCFVLVGIATIIVDYKNIFEKESIILPGYQYLLAYILYFCIIITHELAHGLMCKYFGGKVGKMGLAFIVFNPAMYCDISGVRLFREKYKKIWCSAAGFMANAFFIGFFSILYQFFDTKFLKMMLNITSIMFNVIPFIRLDGYWILSFCVDIDNLYKKSLKKIFENKKKNKFQGWKDYFVFIYGILNSLILLYFTITFIVSMLQLIWTNIK